MQATLTLQYFKECGSRGGKRTSEKYGKEHYLKLAENMNRKKRLKKEQGKTAIAA